MYDERVIRTDNIPLLDELVHQVKKLVLSSVIKDQDKADSQETKQSIKCASLYRVCAEGRGRFELFDYSMETLLEVGIPFKMLEECQRDKNKIPERFRPSLVRRMTDYWLNNYVEYNNYFRMLHGLPDYGDDGIYIDETYVSLESINYDKPIHEQNPDTIDYLYSLGIIDILKNENPDCKYLNYMGTRSIPFLQARKAPGFTLLYCDSNGIEDIIYDKYKERFGINREYTLKRIYSEAFKYGSDYYDSFIMTLICIQTMMDMFEEVPDYIIKMEIFDLRTAKLLFESHGIDYFPDIPKRYQISMLRNINRLIKYKATTKNIVDICSLFGFDNIQVFKYYLLKIRNKNDNGDYIIEYDEEGNENLDAMYDLKFLKVPIEDIPDNYLHDNSKLNDYDSIIYGDKYWDGELDHEYVKHEILKREFNKLSTEYISVDTLYNMTELSFQLCYFYNMMFNHDRLEELLMVNIPCIDSNVNFKLVDILCYMFALGYEYNNVEDRLMDTHGKVLSIMGFNFKANMETLGAYVKDKGFTLEELGVSDFKIPKDQILSYKQLINIFTKNNEIRNHIIKQINNADDYRVFKIYNDIYNSLMVMDLTTEFFKMSDGKQAKTYTEFLKDRDIIIYNSLMNVKRIRNKDTKIETITTHLEQCATIIQQYLDTDDFKFIFNKLPGISMESFKYYIYEVVNFFKSFKVEFLSINTIYLFDDQLENKVNVIDELWYNTVYTKSTVVEIIEKYKNSINKTMKDEIELRESLYKEISYITDKFLDTLINLDDDMSINVNISNRDLVVIADSFATDKHGIKSKFKRYEQVEVVDALLNMINLNPREDINIGDKLYRIINYIINRFLVEEDFIRDEALMIAKKEINTYLAIKEVLMFREVHYK